MDIYSSVRMVHVTCAVLTFSGFVLRGFWVLRGSRAAEHWLRGSLPHINDTLLLASAIGLIWMAGLNPLQHGWLRAKLLALVTYILLGSVALRWGPTRGVRTAAFAGALVTFLYLISVAMTRRVWPPS